MASEARKEVVSACAGLCAPNSMTAAAEVPLYCLQMLLEPPQSLGQHAVFAQAASGGGSPISREEFGALVHMWDTLKLGAKPSAGYLPRFIVGLSVGRCEDATAAALGARLERLLVDGPAVSGKCLDGAPQLPRHLRGTMISQLHVLCRLRGWDSELNEAAQLLALSERCGGLLGQLEAEWYTDDGSGGRQLRREYELQQAKAKVPKKLKC